MSRLAGLNPCHVKIDREILHRQSSDLIIRFVHQIVKDKNLYPPNVIVEGVDEHTPINLYHLKKIGVIYVQGHIVGKPEPEVYRLSQEKYIELQENDFWRIGNWALGIGHGALVIGNIQFAVVVAFVIAFSSKII